MLGNSNIRKKTETHLISNKFFFLENRAFYEIMWKNIVERGRPQMTLWCIRIACWMTEAGDTHSEYAVLTAFAL